MKRNGDIAVRKTALCPLLCLPVACTVFPAHMWSLAHFRQSAGFSNGDISVPFHRNFYLFSRSEPARCAHHFHNSYYLPIFQVTNSTFYYNLIVRLKFLKVHLSRCPPTWTSHLHASFFIFEFICHIPTMQRLADSPCIAHCSNTAFSYYVTNFRPLMAPLNFHLL